MNHDLLKAISYHKQAFYVCFKRYILFYKAFYWTETFLLQEDEYFKCINVYFVCLGVH